MLKTLNIKLLMPIATYLVILLHTAAVPFNTFHGAWSVAVMYDALGRISFPLYLLTAGYISLNKKEIVNIINEPAMPETDFNNNLDTFNGADNASFLNQDSGQQDYANSSDNDSFANDGFDSSDFDDDSFV